MKLMTFQLFFSVFIIWVSISVIKQWPDNFVHIIFCDVGQGDAILITHQGRQMLIDGGPDEKVLSCLEDNMPFWDKSLNLLIATHMDSDHIGGLPAVLASYSADIILKNPSTKKTAVFEAFETAVSRKTANNNADTKVLSSYVGQQLVMDDSVRFVVVSPQVRYQPINVDKIEITETILSAEDTLYYPILEENISENDLSIALFVIINDIVVLLTGDMEEEGELAVIKSGMTEPVSIIKAGHHGSKSSSSRQFISILRPEISVISSGENNQYNHPFPQVIDLFRELGAIIYRTDSQGTVEFVTNGVKYWEAI
ncbi:MBL fold metallo-hydrolase [Patescibacteria group bacterium]|nr:MBL fold metallo-hydrolase [Patescibacteria group bacterium]